MMMMMMMKTTLTYLLTYILIYLLTYLLTPWSRVLLQNLTSSQLVKKFPVFYGSQSSISLSQDLATRPSPEPDQSSQYPYPTTWRSILIFFLPSTPGSSKWSLSRLITFMSLFSTHTCYMLTSFILHDFINIMILGEAYRSLSSSLCSFLHYTFTLTLLSPNIILSTLFSSTLSLPSSLSVSHQITHPYKKTGKIIILYFLIFVSLDSKWKTADPAPNDKMHSLT